MNPARKAVLACCLALGACANRATDTSTAPSAERTALVAEYVKAIDLDGIVARSLENSRKDAAEQLTPIFKQFESLGLSSEGVAEMQVYYRKVFEKALAAVDPAEATRIYAASIADGMPTDALKQGIRYMRTENGRRAYAAAIAAGRALQHYMAVSISGAMVAEVKGNLIPTLKDIVARDQERQKRAAAAAAPATGGTPAPNSH